MKKFLILTDFWFILLDKNYMTLIIKNERKNEVEI
jgi:hypothetical protein